MCREQTVGLNVHMKHNCLAIRSCPCYKIITFMYYSSMTVWSCAAALCQKVVLHQKKRKIRIRGNDLF